MVSGEHASEVDMGNVGLKEWLNIQNIYPCTNLAKEYNL